MTIKRILVPLAGGELDPLSLDAASLAARQFNAHVDVIHTGGTTASRFQFENSRLDTKQYTETLARLQEQERREQAEVRGQFETFVTERGLSLADEPTADGRPSASWLRMEGLAEEIVTTHGGAYDLIVCSHPLLDGSVTPATLIEAAIFGAVRPVLVAHKEVPFRFGRTVAIGWNRGVHCRRAVAAAMPFLEAASHIVIVNVQTGAKQGPEPEEVATTLAWHGVVASVKKLPPDYRSIGETLVDEVHESGAELLVMGGYARHRLQDRLIGSVTKQILSRADFPVLMAR